MIGVTFWAVLAIYLFRVVAEYAAFKGDKGPGAVFMAMLWPVIDALAIWDEFKPT